MRYRLDDLGWFHFELLMQSLLKAECGLLLQSWGGHSDLGRDAYSEQALTVRAERISGPLLFQVKFVQGANASGANWKLPLLKAARKEALRIAERIEQDAAWEPAHYFLITNAPIDAYGRSQLEVILRKQLPSAGITSLGANDVCDLLDQHPSLRRSFPEILSLRDLDALLADAVNRGVLVRSQAAIEESRDLVPVFVPTSAYDLTWKVLEKYSFAVLDGPPEMGKTAIARTVALGHLLAGWQAIECRGPDDFFGAYDEQNPQVFVADDAFGRTEFDPTLARAWERDLPRVFHRLGNKHRLIWTTRKHILQRALREMDLTGKAKAFPDPGEIIVTADDLTLEEKSRILYRHGKQTTLRARPTIRRTATRIVNHPHFTPERIRRAVTEVITETLLDLSEQKPKEADELLLKSVKDPTGRMRKAFQKLTREHQMILVALLDAGYVATHDAVRQKFAAMDGGGGPQFDVCLDDLVGTFVKRRLLHERATEEAISWIHPSYRDLVIDELIQRPDLRRTFIATASPQGIALAVSESGGGEGRREFPLLADSTALCDVVERCTALAGNDEDALITLHVLKSAVVGGGAPAEIRNALRNAAADVASVIVRRWSADDSELSDTEIHSYFNATDILSPFRPLPPIESVWTWLCGVVDEEIRIESYDVLETLERWPKLRDIIEQYYEDFARTERYRQLEASTSQGIYELAGEQASRRPWSIDYDDAEEEANRLQAFSELISSLDRDGYHAGLSDRLMAAASEFNALVSEDSDLSYDRERPSAADFSVEEFFADL